MKRDMDLIRKLLLFVEAHGDDRHSWIDDVQIDGYSESQVSYHVWLLGDAGFIEVIDLSAEDTCWRPRCLTWRGTEFLDSVRERDVWEKTKAIAQQAGSVSLKLMMEIAVRIAQDRIAGILQ